MNKLHAVLIAAMAAAPLPSLAAGANITGTVGFRQLSSDWDPTDTQAILGVLTDFSFWDAPLHIELGLRGSSDSGDVDGNRVKLGVGDFLAGVMFIPDRGYMRPYFSLGLASVYAETKFNGAKDDDTSEGYYVAGGLMWRPAPNFDIGVDARYIGGTDLELNGNAVDVDNFSVALRVGYGFDLRRRRYQEDYPPPPPRRPYPRRY
jgi:opacity protein-like surface antigen